MKKNYIKIFLPLLFFSFSFSIKSQINYTFSTASVAYAANGGASIATGDDVVSSSTAIGFTFQFGCTNYTTFQASTNGVMFLGTAGAFSDASNNLNTNSDRPALGPLWDDLATGAGGSVNWKLTGVAGSRILTVEWLNMKWYYSNASTVMSFQVKLYETSNRIEFLYSQLAGAPSSASASIGISGATSGDFYSLSDASAAPTVSKVTETTNIATKPATNQVYRWDPVLCSGSPTGGTANASVTSGCTGLTSVISLSGGAAGCGLSYQWQSSPDNATWSNIAGATSLTYTATVASTTYYHCVTTCSNGGGTGTSTSATVTILPNCYTMGNGTINIASCPFTGSFYDSGGNSSPYSSSENFTKTFTAPAGSCVTVTFTTFTVESSYDYLHIYDGTTTGATQFGTGYTGGTSPGTITSSGSSLTFNFTSDGSGNANGWDATITCATSCVGTPAAGTANATAPACPAGTSVLSLTGGAASGCGISFQWQSSPDNATWSNIAGGTTSTYTASVSGTTYYHCTTTCSNSGISSTSTATNVTSTVPSNNDCANAINLGSVTTATTTTGTNVCTTGDQSSSCHTPAENVWYKFTVPAGGGSYDVSVNGISIVDPCLSVYSGTCGSLTNVACTYGTTTSAGVGANCLTAGTYYINVDDDLGTAGTFSLTVTQTISGSGPPANNDCAGATLLTTGAACAQTAATTACATQSIAGCSGGNANDDVWFKFVATSTTQYINVTASSGFDPVVQLLSGACNGVQIWCNDAAFTTGNSGTKNYTAFTVGSTYYIRVFDYSSGTPTTSSFSICVTDPPSCPASLGTGVVNVPSLPYSNLGATTCGMVNDISNSNVTNICGTNSYYKGEDMVYAFTPATTGVVTITQSNTSGTVGMILYDGCPFTANCVANAENSDASKTICTTLTAGTTYYLVIDSWPSPSCYLYDINISAPVAGIPPGTTCASADPITTLPFSKTGLSTCCKNNDYTSANACASLYMGGEDYVFSYTPASNITIDITLSNTLPSVGLFVTQGCPTAGVCTAINTNSSGNPSLCGIALTGGVTYYIIVDTDPSPSCTPFDIYINQDNAATTCNMAYTAATMAFSAADPLSTGTILSFPDDHFATAYTPIGFNFCFDGIQYSQVLVSSNAYLIFDPIYCSTNLPGSNATPSGYSAWSISGAIPNTTNAPRNAILGPWHDIDPGVAGNIRYTTYGTTPNQRFVVSYDNIAMFSCNSILFSGQIKLFETSNNIEVHLGSKNLCTSWNSGQAILGLHNYNGTIAVVPAGGYNAPTQWSAANKAWQFTTACATCLTLLPVDVTSFTGKKHSDAANELTWITSAEKNVKDFILERSLDGNNFTSIGVLHAKNKATGGTYSFMDNIPDMNQTYYYRLTSLDLNGAEKKSGLVVVERKSYVFAPFSLYPNPTTSSFIIEAEVNEASRVKVITYDLFGKICGEQFADLQNGFNAIEVSVDKYAPGMYYVKVVSANDLTKQLFIEKVVKQ
jgi:hypothetical protein